MRKVKFFGLLLAAGLFSACSDNLDDAGNAGGTTPDVTEGYVKVAINMPTTSGNTSRSTDNGAAGAVVDLVDGEANEYNVENAILVFFKGNNNNEAEATFVKAYALGEADLSVSGSNETPQVTEQVSVITEAPKVEDGKQLYVLAILNYNDVLSVDTNGDLTVNGTKLNNDSKLSALQDKITATIDKFIGESKDMFTMTNAPLSDKAGTSSNMTNAKAYTLVPIKVYDTKAAAANAVPAKIYVERVVAKVTLTSSHKVDNNQIKVTDANGNETGDIVEITGWCLNVTNNSTKLVRDVTGFNSTNGWLNATNSERFAGTRGIDASFGVASEGDYYRIYWAQDCNYYAAGSGETDDVTTVENDFTTYTSTGGKFTPTVLNWNTTFGTSSSTACYCLENTMNYTEQKDDRTTGVLIRTNYLTKFDGEKDATAKSFFVCGTSSTKYPEQEVSGSDDGKSTKAFVDQIIEAANKLITNESYKLSDTGAEGLSLKSDLKQGTYTDVTDVFDFTETNTESEKYKAQLAAVRDAVGGRISYYEDGVNYYYSSLIRHFQDGEGVGITTGAGVASANDYTLDHLGRYGVVRNNWYEIDINSVSGPGTPDVEQPGGNPDDSTEGYINCTINVLSWAKRSQSVDL